MVYYRIGTGELDGAIDDIITCQRLGRHMEHQGTSIARLVGISIQGIAGALGIAADQKSQPTEAQLQRLVKELNALPARPDTKPAWLIERYYALDAIQGAAVRKESLEGAFAFFGGVRELWGWDSERPGLAIAKYISVDWNTVLGQVNARFDDVDNVDGFPRPTLWSPGNLLIGSRSRRVGDFLMAVSGTPALQVTREANCRADCVSNLQRIVLAMLLYEREHGTLPPAYTVDADGNPLHSWRVLLLTCLGKRELYDKIRLAEPWDSQHNRQFHEAALDVYQCPSASLGAGQTRYSVVVGKKTAFQAAKGKTLDGLGTNLILVVERKQPVCWMAPTAELAEAVAFVGIGTSRRNENADEI
jgi:hypothetical protein